MNTFALMLNQTLGLLVMIALGYLMNKKRIISAESKTVLSHLATRVLLPALICDSFIENCTLENLVSCSPYVLAGGVVIFVSVFVSIPICHFIAGKNATDYEKGIYRYCLSIPNAAAFGMPVVQAFYGTEGLFRFNLFLTIGNVVCYTWGIRQLIPKSGAKKSLAETVKDVILNPVILAMLVGAAFGITGLTNLLPGFLLSSLTKLSNCYSPICLILVGYSIADFKPREILWHREVYLMTFFRLLFVPALFLIGGRLLGVDADIMVMTLMFMACPCGMNSVVFPAAYGQDTRTGAGIVMVTCILAVFTIPLFYSLL